MKLNFLLLPFLLGNLVLAADAQTALPPLHTLKSGDIASISSNFEKHVLTVTLTNGTVYAYNHEDWDMEEDYPLSPKLQDAINSVKITFTRVEVAPQFPGGDSAWEDYMREFCARHKDDLPKKEPVEVRLTFIVHLKGELRNFQVVSNTGRSKMADLAIQALKEGPSWICATQNHYKVVSYRAQLVRLTR
jgi:hypothetical protein